MDKLIYSHSVVSPCYCRIREGCMNYKSTIYNPDNKHNIGKNEDEIELIFNIDEKGRRHVYKKHYCSLCKNLYSSNNSFLNK